MFGYSEQRTVPPEVTKGGAKAWTRQALVWFNTYQIHLEYRDAVQYTAAHGVSYHIRPPLATHNPIRSTSAQVAQFQQLTKSGTKVKDQTPAEHLQYSNVSHICL